MAALSHPPGRIGRLWVLNRLDLAERGVTLLEQKLHLLTRTARRAAAQGRTKPPRLAAGVPRGRQVGAARGAAGRPTAIDLAVTTAPASVTVQWAVTAGVRYPDVAECTLPAPESVTEIYVNSATVQATRAHRAAVIAAARCAAAQSALATIDRELRATQLRARALSEHWMPRLRGELDRIELELEEQDRAEAVRLRLVERGRRT